MSLPTAYWIADDMTTALGSGTDANASAVVAYQSGLKKTTNGKGFVGAIDLAQVPENESLTRLERLMVSVAKRTLGKTSVDCSADDFGIVFSTTKGNIDQLTATKIDERAFLQTFATRVCRELHVKSQPIVISNACISGISALIVASRLIEERAYKHVLVIGGDLLSEFVVSGFCSFKSVSEQICKPYDAARNGLSMGEACGAVLLSADKCLVAENEIVSIAAGAISNDANHISGPSRTGDGLHLAIRRAMNEACVAPNDIAFVSAHGTATIYNDEMESKALALAHCSDILTNSLKPYFGHTLGACGVIESILSVWQLRHKMAFGTLGFQTLGVPQPMYVSATHQPLGEQTCCLKIASGFGGCNAAMVIRRGANAAKKLQTTDCQIDTLAQLHWKSAGEPFHDFIRTKYRETCEPNMKFFKMDNQCKLGYVAAENLLQNVDFEDKTRVALILTNRASSLDTDWRHQQLLESGEAVSPAVFVYTLPNIVAGEICIRHHLQGENTFFVRAENDDFARQYATTILQRGEADNVVCGWCEVLGDDYEVQLELLTKK